MDQETYSLKRFQMAVELYYNIIVIIFFYSCLPMLPDNTNNNYHYYNNCMYIIIIIIMLLGSQSTPTYRFSLRIIRGRDCLLSINIITIRNQCPIHNIIVLIFKNIFTRDIIIFYEIILGNYTVVRNFQNFKYIILLFITYDTIYNIS